MELTTTIKVEQVPTLVDALVKAANAYLHEGNVEQYNSINDMLETIKENARVNVNV